jgi:methylthioribose-1-phosphate isomerase
MNVTVDGRTRHYRTVSFDHRRNTVLLIDQRLLPHRFKIIAAPDFRATARAIEKMTVRGAGAIGAAAAYGLAQGARAFRGNDPRKFARHVHAVFQALQSARPTAVDPVNAMLAVLLAMRAGQTVAGQKIIAMNAADKFADQDVQHCQAIGRHGVGLIHQNARLLTHCNAGWLAFVDIGSATAPMYAAQQAGRNFHVYCDETRPRCQGATLTAWELSQQKISHQIISDNAAGHLMQRGKIDLVIVGSDRVLGRTGEVANKIGTYTKAVLARRHNIPFYVAIPLSTIDWNLRSGLDIPIEERDESETLGAWGVITRPSVKRTDRGAKFVYVRIANPNSTAHNPGFDVTPAELITGIITPFGIIAPGDLWKRRKRLGYRKETAGPKTTGPAVQSGTGKTELA